MPWLLLVFIGLWFVFGDPPKTIANWFWHENAAPWETVDAFYYPNKSELSVFEVRRGLSNLEECRYWVRIAASANNDHDLKLGDYECGVQPLHGFGGLTVYRLTVR